MPRQRARARYFVRAPMLQHGFFSAANGDVVYVVLSSVAERKALKMPRWRALYLVLRVVKVACDMTFTRFTRAVRRISRVVSPDMRMKERVMFSALVDRRGKMFA